MQQNNNKTDKKSKLKQIAAIGLPAVIESILLVVITAIDTKMISGLGKAAVSAVFSFGVWGIWIASLCSQVCWLVMSSIKGRQCMNRLPS